MPINKDMIENIDDRMNRCPTGIIGFDELCEGGLLKNSVNFIQGNSGAGKTTFLLQFLYNGFMKYNENGLYVSFEETLGDLIETAKLLEMDFLGFESNNCQFVKFKPNASLQEIQKEIIKRIGKYDIKRICFDPINVFASQLPKETSLRRQLYEFFELLKELDICVVIAGETNNDLFGKKSKVPKETSYANFFSDSIITMFSSGISGKGDRAIQILKMRKTKHFRGPVGMELTNQGIKILD